MTAIDGTQLELVATAPSQVQCERWVRAFVMAVNANYVEKTVNPRRKSVDVGGPASLPNTSSSSTHRGVSRSSSANQELPPDSIHAFTVDVGSNDGGDAVAPHGVTGSKVVAQRVPFSRFAGQAVLLVNVDVDSPHAQAQFGQLQVRAPLADSCHCGTQHTMPTTRCLI